MRLTERLIAGQNRDRLAREREAERQQEENQEDETGYAYRAWPKHVPLNDEKGVFAHEDRTSLNTRPSVFDATAVFHTKES